MRLLTWLLDRIAPFFGTQCDCCAFTVFCTPDEATRKGWRLPSADGAGCTLCPTCQRDERDPEGM